MNGERSLPTPLARPLRATIDLAAIAHNTAIVRQRIGPDVRFYAVCKNDACGAGAREVAPTLIRAGADAFAVSTIEDAESILRADLHRPILLYPALPADMLADASKLGVTISIHDHASLDAAASANHDVPAFIKVDCGFGRLGVLPDDFPEMMAMIAKSTRIKLKGLYTHFSSVENPDFMRKQIVRFEKAIGEAKAAGFSNIEIMAASSRVIRDYPELNFNAVNPGRFLFGLIEDDWGDAMAHKPAISITSRIVQIKALPANYGARRKDESAPKRIAVVIGGFRDGLPQAPSKLSFLVRGQRAPLVSPPTTEYCSIDITNINGVTLDDEVVLLGAQSDQTMSCAEFAQASGFPALSLVPQIAKSVPRIYLD